MEKLWFWRVRPPGKDRIGEKIDSKIFQLFCLDRKSPYIICKCGKVDWKLPLMVNAGVKIAGAVGKDRPEKYG
jgi:hypothetical protein